MQVRVSFSVGCVGGGGGGQNTQLQGKREVVGEGEHMVAEKDTVCGIH